MRSRGVKQFVKQNDFVSGRAHRTRTCNLLIKSQLLCQIELAPHFVAAERNSNTYLVAVASVVAGWTQQLRHPFDEGLDVLTQNGMVVAAFEDTVPFPPTSSLGEFLHHPPNLQVVPGC